MKTFANPIGHIPQDIANKIAHHISSVIQADVDVAADIYISHDSSNRPQVSFNISIKNRIPQVITNCQGYKTCTDS